MDNTLNSLPAARPYIHSGARITTHHRQTFRALAFRPRPFILHITENEAVSNSGRPYPGGKFPIRPRFDNLPFCVPSGRCRGRQKNEPRRGIRRPLARLGAWLLLSTAEVFWVETKNCSKMPLLLPGRAAVENRHAGTGEVINSSALGW
jgi:hypothetical protein